MDKKTRNLELEAWLIETTGEEMMANHLGPNWNRFNDEMCFYPNMSMTIADLVWQHQQAKVEELQNKCDGLLELVKYDSKAQAEMLNKIDELQKRVDKALAVIMEYYTGSYEESPDLVVDLEQALKGESFGRN